MLELDTSKFTFCMHVYRHLSNSSYTAVFGTQKIRGMRGITVLGSLKKIRLTRKIRGIQNCGIGGITVQGVLF